jgi:hypothetical protein
MGQSNTKTLIESRLWVRLRTIRLLSLRLPASSRPSSQALVRPPSHHFWQTEAGVAASYVRRSSVDYLWVIDRAVDRWMTLGAPRQTRVDRWVAKYFDRSYVKGLSELLAQALFPVATRRCDRLGDEFYRASHRLRLAMPPRSVNAAMDAAEAHLRRWDQMREDAWLESWKSLRRHLHSACQEAVGGKPLPAGIATRS